MNTEYTQLLKKAQGRYFDEQEGARLRAYALGLLSRLEQARSVEENEHAILDDVVQAVRAEFPDIEELHGPDGYQKVRRDYLLILRYATLAMVTADPNMMRDKLAIWLRTILEALVGLDRILVGLNALRQAVATHLEADAAALIHTHLDVVIEEMNSGRRAA